MNARREITGALILLLFGAGYLAYSTEYPLDTWNNPGPSAFPLLMGSLLILVASGHLIHSLRIRKRHEQGENAQPAKKPLSVSRPLILAGYLTLYVLLIQWAGFFLSTAAFVMMSSRLMGAEGWPKPFVLGIGVDLFCYWVFEGWLKLSLPKGFLL